MPNPATLIPLSPRDSAPLYVEMMGAVSFDDRIKNGKAKLTGDRKPYDELKNKLVQFDMGFEILPGTGARDLTEEKKTFEMAAPSVQSIID